MEELNPTKTPTQVPVIEQNDSVVILSENSKKEIEQELNEYIASKLKRWVRAIQMTKVKMSMTAVSLLEIDYKKLKISDRSLFGQYTENLETVAMDYKKEKFTVKILKEELEQFIGKSRSEVMAYIIETYSKEYYIPGFGYGKYLSENPNEIPEKLFKLFKNNFFNLMGSTFCDGSGRWTVPCIHYGVKSSRMKNAISLAMRWLNPNSDLSNLDSDWSTDDSVILLEKPKS